ncbi:MAG TPA: hypothetical protein VFS00_12835, partial [Polyangiaceae bacterium]|nr:hypothetical protein [Polyangiaceae bacterium]
MNDDAIRREYVRLLKRALNGYLQFGGGDDVGTYFPLNKRVYDFDACAWRLPEDARPHTVLAH